jgi:hypothetical protein
LENLRIRINYIFDIELFADIAGIGWGVLHYRNSVNKNNVVPAATSNFFIQPYRKTFHFLIQLKKPCCLLQDPE